MLLKNIRFVSAVTVGGHVITTASVGSALGTWADGPTVTAIETVDAIVTLHLSGGDRVAYHGTWCGEVALPPTSTPTPERKGGRR